MKKWLVECHIDNREQFYSREPPSGIFYDATDDFVEAETEDDAIELSTDWIAEHTIRNAYDVETFDDTVVVYGDDGNVKEYYFEFRAREVE